MGSETTARGKVPLFERSRVQVSSKPNQIPWPVECDLMPVGSYSQHCMYQLLREIPQNAETDALRRPVNRQRKMLFC